MTGDVPGGAAADRAPAFTRQRDQTICRQAPQRVGVPLALTLGLAALVVWWTHWPALVLVAFLALGTAMEAITWLRARRRLAHPDLADPRPAARTRRPPSEQRQDPDVGPIEWRAEHEGWCLDHPLGDETIVVCLEGPRAGGPTARAKALWRSVEPGLAALWGDVVAFTRAWSLDHGGAALDAAGLRLEQLGVFPDSPVEGGELAFDFAVAADPDGSYLVPVHQGKPLLVHRDS